MGRGIYTSSAAFRLSRFSRPYRQRLLAGLQDLESFCHGQGPCSLAALLRNLNIADEVLSLYVMQRHVDPEKKQLYVVKHALLCCQHVQPKLKGRINTAWENLRVWEEQRTSSLRPPLPIPLWLLMVGLARARSSVIQSPSEKQRWQIFATLLEVGVLCMLRPGELLKLKHTDVSLPGGFTFSQPFAAIRVANPKNRRQFGVDQFVLVKNPCTVQRLRDVVEERNDCALWKGGRILFSRMFKQVCKELRISECRFTPASLRPGGATMYYGRGIPISTLRFMGRWTVEKSLEHYIQLAMSTQIMNRLSAPVISRLKKLAPLCLEFVVPMNFVEKLQLFELTGNPSSSVIADWCARYAFYEG